MHAAESDLQCLRIVVMGAPGVGKTCLIEQCVRSKCPEDPLPTLKPRIYYPAIVINDHMYDARLIECPVLSGYFPSDSLQEWTGFGGCRVRSASAYILVYDVTSEETFQFIKSIREQMLEQGIEAPTIIVANKSDLLGSINNKSVKREITNIVKKHWKCVYVECSAKYNWHVTAVFKELMKIIDYRDFGHKPAAMRMQDAFRRNRCHVM